MASGPGNEWQIRLDAAAEVYVASLRSAGLVFSLPRRTIEDAVFAAAEITLQLTPDGCLVVHADSSDKRPLTDVKISALVASAVTADALKAKDDAVFLKRVEAELLSALEAVRQARGR
jgi:hypothetical protein